MMPDDSGSDFNRRERLLEWIRGGDCSRVPVMFCGGNRVIASSLYNMPPEKVTWQLACRAAVETKTDAILFLGTPVLLRAIDFADNLKLEHSYETLADGTRRRTSVLTTPAGSLREVHDEPPGIGPVRREFFVKGEEDFPAIESFFRIALDTILKNPAVREKAFEDMRPFADIAKDAFPTAIHPFCPAVEFMSSMYSDQQTAIYLLYDHREVMEELFDLHWKATRVWLEVAERLDVDIYHFAINGLEWLSLDIYERYMVPQAKRIVEFADSLGKLSWVHTCGKKSGLIDRGVYERMGVKVIESLSAPPTGDISDYAWARAKLGPEVTTRGGLNCELFYEDSPDALKAHAHKVLDGCRGYRHMIGDTNGSIPTYRWEMYQAVIDVVHERGCSFY